MKLAESICFALSKFLFDTKSFRTQNYQDSMFSEKGYDEWRSRELEIQYQENFNPLFLQNKDILDFGCGRGGLAFFCKKAGARKIIGIDLNEAVINAAVAKKEQLAYGEEIAFIVSNNEKRIDLSDECVDIILCFDVLEHVMQVDSILDEWVRILRSKGRILIWWSSWWGPFGPHIESLVPIPWAHILFSEKTLIKTAARIYDTESFVPRIWDINSKSGQKKPNKWKELQVLPDVNKMSVKQFERKLTEKKQKGEILDVKARHHGFQGSRLSRLTNVFLSLPALREFFLSYVTYEIIKA